ncbi:hypothetical protein LWI29_016455 [Acer saccharum]|uniref:Retrovirus-related Pol polyprotein from transposon TNT 1-94-like beta-barrel domain-containing protein n=1 Tax=Acer saccharum TaxID=4024 RepID=A0AA39SVJ1_ACESA|nr:hypothetical protein LWI29_016455 [Acer saccharum]
MNREEGKEDGVFMLACNAKEEEPAGVWYIDSGCSNHVTGDKNVFTFLDESIQSEVKTGDDKKHQVRGKGDVLIKSKEGAKKIIDVYYVLGFKHNLLSVGQIMQKGKDVRFNDGFCVVRDKKSKLITKIQMAQNRMFPLKFVYEKMASFNAVMNNESWLWYHRYGHVEIMLDYDEPKSSHRPRNTTSL